MDHSPPCHPVIYELELVKNTNKISIFHYFLDTVVKPWYDPEGVRLPRRCYASPRNDEK
ncbi:MAG: palindromic element RPE4 domain-containing protein [Janthinobacterium lividum]